MSNTIFLQSLSSLSRCIILLYMIRDFPPPQSGSPLLETKAFCHRVSSAEYEQQRLSVTDSLTTLLDNILTDTSMNHKLKKQRLKQVSRITCVRCTLVVHVS